MSRSNSFARWASYALLAAVAVPVATAPAFADRDNKRSMATCAAFDQTDKDDDTTTFTIRNACGIPVDCAISWKLVCAPDSKKRRTEHPSSQTICSLADGAQQSTDASAVSCGADAWAIQNIQWSCSPNKD